MYTEGLVFMVLQPSEFLSIAKIEGSFRLTSDTTWNCIRESDNLLNHFDSSRLAIKVSVDNNGRKQLEEMGDGMMQGAPKDIQMQVMASKLFKAFKFKASSNSKSHSGSMKENGTKSLDALKLVNPQLYNDLVKMSGSDNFEKYANWAALLEKVAAFPKHDLTFPDNINMAPFLKDLIVAFQTHAVYDYNVSFVLDNKQASLDMKTQGAGKAFDDLYKIFF